MTEITRYEAAKRALAECKSIDEVKDIRDKAMALRAYAQQAKDYSLERDSIAIRMRAEREYGIRIEHGKADRAPHGENRFSRGLSKNPLPTLKELGADKNLAHRARTLARMDEPEFEAHVKRNQEQLTAALNRKVVLEQERKSPDIIGVIYVLENLDIYSHKKVDLFHLRAVCEGLIKRIDQASRENVVCLSTTAR